MRHLVKASEFLRSADRTAETEAAAKSVDDLVRTRTERKKAEGEKPKFGRKASVQKAIEEAKGLVKAGQYNVATPSQLVGLYYLCHEKVYGAVPSELVGEEWRKAVLAAANLVRREFRGDSAKAIEFVRWTWRREAWREGRRKEEDRRWRITWRNQFCRADLQADYYTEMARKKKHGGG